MIEMAQTKSKLLVSIRSMFDIINTKAASHGITIAAINATVDLHSSILLKLLSY